MTSYSETADFTPTAFTVDNQHHIITDPTATFGGLFAVLVAVKMFFENLPGMTGAWGEAAAPYPWDSVRTWYFVLSTIVIVVSVLLIIIILIFAFSGNDAASPCCNGAPLARKSFRHYSTVLEVHFSHFVLGWIIITTRWGFNKYFTSDGVLTAFPAQYLQTFYYMHAIEFIACGILGVGAFMRAVPYLWFAEGNASFAKVIHSSKGVRQNP